MLGIFDDLCQDESDDVKLDMLDDLTSSTPASKVSSSTVPPTSDDKFDMLDDLISSTPASKVSSSTVPPTSSSDSKVTSSSVGSTSCLAPKVPSLSVSSTSRVTSCLASTVPSLGGISRGFFYSILKIAFQFSAHLFLHPGTHRQGGSEQIRRILSLYSLVMVVQCCPPPPKGGKLGCITPTRLMITLTVECQG